MKNCVPVEWGDFSYVEALLRSIEWALSYLEFDWLMLLSAQDYPVRPLSVIESFLQDCGYDALIRGFLITKPNSWPEGEGIRRYFYRYYKLPRFQYYYMVPGTLRTRLEQFKISVNSAQSIVQIRNGPRRIPLRFGIRRLRMPFENDFACYGGPDWFDLSRKCVEYIHAFVRENREYVDYYKRTFLPSESFFSTILLNNPSFKILPNNKRFVHWDPINRRASSPLVLRTENFETIMQADAHFARKFDISVDSNILDLIDERTGNSTSH